MGRRRRRYESEEPGLMQVAIELAWASPIAGAIFAGFLLLISLVCGAWQTSPGSPTALLMPLLSLLFGIVGGLGLLVSAIGFVRDLLTPRR